MTPSLTLPSSTLAALRRLPAPAAELLMRSWEPSTLRAYGRWIAALMEWLYEQGQEMELPLHPDLAMAWVVELRRRRVSPSTLTVAMSALSAAHTAADLASPCQRPQVRRVVAGALRDLWRHRAPHDAHPLLPEDLRRMLAAAEQDAQEGRGRYARVPALLERDRVVLLLGFAGGFRRSELCGLTLGAVRVSDDALEVSLGARKGHYGGEAHVRRICATGSDLCPLAALRRWLDVSGIRDGALLRAYTRHGRQLTRPIGGSSVDHVVRSLAAPLQPTDGAQLRYSAHSLRAGFATAAALAGKPDREIAEHLGHRSLQTTARYVRVSRVRASTVTRGIGLE